MWRLPMPLATGSNHARLAQLFLFVLEEVYDAEQF
jgi:hypothetical protein